MDLIPLTNITPDMLPRVGGKALRLAQALKAGFPVPQGFAVTTDATCVPPESVLGAFDVLQTDRVAVRSSSIHEDGLHRSHAGLFDSFLDVPRDRLLESIDACRRSANSERARAYRERNNQSGVEDMAVLVQTMIHGDVSGVLFTADPARRDAMVAEAVAGSCLAVVSGSVSPDTYRFDKSGACVANQGGCLTPDQARQLGQLGVNLRAAFGHDVDVEWTYQEGRFWVLQVRPITVMDSEREQVRREEIEAVKAAEGTVWSRDFWGDAFPIVTPMTWAVLQRLTSATGGLGRLYRDLGFDSDPSLGDRGTLDLIGARPFVNLDRSLRLQFAGWPWRYDTASLHAHPAEVIRAKPVFASEQAGWKFWLKLPWYCYLLWRSADCRRQLRRTFPQRWESEILPRFLSDIETAAEPESMSPHELFAALDHWIERVVREFASESLKPTLLAAELVQRLEQVLARETSHNVQAVVAAALGDARPKPEADLAWGFRQWHDGVLDLEGFLQRYGHRGFEEMELSRPRWREGPPPLHGHSDVPKTESAEEKPPLSRLASSLAREARELIALRETAKHYFMLGYSHIRRILTAIDDRLNLQGGVFFLTPAELRLSSDEHRRLIDARRRRQQIAASLYVPNVVFRDDAEAIGMSPAVSHEKELQGTPVSGGSGEGWAVSVEECTSHPQPHVLICPTSDPAWVPKFAGAAAIVFETGGTLSHGAIVAREFAIPAVVLPDARRMLTGTQILVDGATGRVSIVRGKQPS